MTEQIEQNAYAQFLVRTATDEAFRAALLADAKGALKSQGVEIPEGIEITVVEDTPAQLHLVLPPKLSEELSAEELEAINGGFFDKIKMKHVTAFMTGYGTTMVAGLPVIIMTQGAAFPAVKAGAVTVGVGAAIAAD